MMLVMAKTYHLPDAFIFHNAQIVECQLGCFQIQSMVANRASKVSVVIQQKGTIPTRLASKYQFNRAQ